MEETVLEIHGGGGRDGTVNALNAPKHTLENGENGKPYAATRQKNDIKMF